MKIMLIIEGIQLYRKEMSYFRKKIWYYWESVFILLMQDMKRCFIFLGIQLSTITNII